MKIGIVVMGVSGSGKSTVCAAVRRRLERKQSRVDYLDADDFHSTANKAKMAQGTSLSEDDRGTWLASIVDAMSCRAADVILLACSALRKQHRDVLRAMRRPDFSVLFFHLQGSLALISQRVRVREAQGEHFMPASLLVSQVRTLEPPDARNEPDVVALALVNADGHARTPDELAHIVVTTTGI
jgi:carbohydrate kinase (thermoresistant glucokinase family)